MAKRKLVAQLNPVNCKVVEEHVLELGKLIVDKYEEKYHLDCNLGELGGV